jgi:molecular chaperone GrpE
MSNDANAQAKDEASPVDEVAAAPDLAALEAELAKARDAMLRALAEAENTRRRAERQVQEARAYAIDRFAGDLVPAADALSRALATAPREIADEGVRNMIAGLELTERSLFEAFARHGLRRVGAKGDAFDPNLHQAVAQAPSDQPAGTVLEVLQPGYVLADRTLRAAMVLVSGGPAGAKPAGPSLDIKV